MDQLKMIPNYIYFYHLDEFCVLPFYPEEISDSMSSKFAETNALSRSSPVFSYINSGPRQVQLNLNLHRDLMNDLNKDISNIKKNVVDFSKEDYVDTLVKYLQAIALPRYKNYSAGSRSVIPPMIAVRFGNDIFIKGVVTSGIQTTYRKPIMVDNKYAQITLSFTVYEVDPYDADYVAGKYDNGEGGSFRGLFDSNFRGGIYKVNNPSNSAPSSNGHNNTGSNRVIDIDVRERRSLTTNNYLPEENLAIIKQQYIKQKQRKQTVRTPWVDIGSYRGWL